VNVRRRFVWRRKSGHVDVSVESRDGRRVTVRIGDEETTADCAKLPGGRSTVILPSGRQLTGRAAGRRDGRVEAWNGARRVHLELADPLEDLVAESAHAPGGATEIRAQIPGRVVEVRVCPGDRVSAGMTLLVLEAMKMQNEIRAEAAALVVRVDCVPGQTVETGFLLVRLESESVG
jgi:biotin carboxyl carrier protein